MIGYTTLGTNDLDRAIKFYDALFTVLDARKIPARPGMVLWGNKEGAMLAMCEPYDEKEATCGNGVMIALNVGSEEKVKALYAKALELGASDEGAPDFRGGTKFYGAYFRDLDGNKFCAFHFEPFTNL